MPNVVVMTDNVACIPSDVAEKNRIKIVPTANILFDGKAYTEGIDITASEAYELITRDPDKFETRILYDHNIFVRSGNYVSKKYGPNFVRVSFSVPEDQCGKFVEALGPTIESMI